MTIHRSRRSANSLRRRRGATVVEFALVAPVIFLFVFGIIEFGRLVMVQQSLTNAAREGCRTAVLATTTSQEDADAAVRGYLQSGISDSSNVDKVRVSVTPASLAGISSGTSVTVEVEVNYSDVSWLPGNLLGFVGDPVLGAQSTQERE